MYALLALSVYVLAVIIFKLIQFIRSNVFERDFVQPAIKELRSGDRVHAVSALKKIHGPIARIILVSFECMSNRGMSAKNKEAEITRVGVSDIRYLESHLRGLELVAMISPLVGLFGTVVGMINSFSKLSVSGVRVDPSILAGGIWEALLTTAGGLAVAIPAISAYYIFDGIIEKVRAVMKDASVQVLAMEDEIFADDDKQPSLMAQI